MHVIDTNVISELRRIRPHGGVMAWFKATALEEMAIPAIVLGELQAGIETTRRSDLTRAADLETWLDQIELSWNIVAMDGACFREWSRIMHGKSPELAEDAMIAATARTLKAIVVTRNVRDFESFGVRVFNPFLYRA